MKSAFELSQSVGQKNHSIAQIDILQGNKKFAANPENA
jgi:hypothetical protein